MATYKHLRSSTANKRPTTSIADGQLAINSNAASAGLFFKDSTGATIIKVGPVHVGTTAPNATPGAGGSSGNSTGEVWLDTSLTPVGVKIWNGSAWVNGTPAGTTTVQGLLELATDVETQAGSDTARAVTPSSLQSKVSDSTSTTSSTTIASSTAVKSAFDLANAALPKSGGTVTGNLEIGTTGSLTFEGSVADGFETTIAVTNPTADRTITLPNQTGNVLVSGNASIVNADVNASAAIAGTKISPDFGSQNVTTTGTSTAASFIPTSSAVPTNGLYLPSAGSVAISTAGSGRLFVDASGNVGVNTSSPDSQLTISRGTTSAYSIKTIRGSRTDQGIYTDGTGVYLLGNDTSNGATYVGVVGDNVNSNNYKNIILATYGTERLRITSAGLVGVGTSAPSTTLDVNGELTLTAGVAGWRTAAIRAIDEGLLRQGALAFYTHPSSGTFVAPTERMRLDSSGRVGIGTTDPSAAGASAYRDLVIAGTGNRGITIQCGSGNVAGTVFNTSNGGNAGGYIYDSSAAQMLISAGGATSSIAFHTNSAERFRCDSSGRLLVGTSSSSASATIVAQGNSAGSTSRGILYLSLGANNPADGAPLGHIEFSDSTPGRAATIAGQRDGGTWTAGSSHPGRLVFSTTADGASSPTERMRITQAGTILFGKTANDQTSAGVQLIAGGRGSFATNGTECIYVNRNTDDGNLVELAQGGTIEGTISVSGTTVSYNGAHLSRWSQLPSGAERTEIMRGTVLSNIDEMCEWGEEDNEQLNRMKVSDVEGDKNVSGVFQAWDDDDDTYTNDFYCAMTGDFIIRIAEGVTVERGDLLMSAGDGTAKPQDDDIIRSKTIAKVTSTNVSCTYDDGSYCVPCVLMAC